MIQAWRSPVSILLCLAIIAVRLEDEPGGDPFSADEDAERPVTLGDFIRFYEDAAK